MPLSARSRFGLATVLVVALLAWPRALPVGAMNAIPLVGLLVVMVAVGSAAYRIGQRRAGEPTTDKVALGIELAMAPVGILAVLVCSERPTAFDETDERGSVALVHFYDPCERRESAVVCSGVVPSIGYVCKGGHTERVERCPVGVCRSIPLSAQQVEGHQSSVVCEDLR